MAGIVGIMPSFLSYTAASAGIGAASIAGWDTLHGTLRPYSPIDQYQDIVRSPLFAGIPNERTVLVPKELCDDAPVETKGGSSEGSPSQLAAEGTIVLGGLRGYGGGWVFDPKEITWPRLEFAKKGEGGGSKDKRQSEAETSRLMNLIVEMLSRNTTEEIIEICVRALDDPLEGVRDYAALSLGEYGDPRAVEPLIRILADPDEYKRKEAAKGLGEIADPRAVKPLIMLLGDSNEEVRMAAARALENIGAPAVEELIQALGHPQPRIRAGAAMVLGWLEDVRAEKPLYRALVDPEEIVRKRAAVALEFVAVIPSWMFLVGMLGSANLDARKFAAYALRELEDLRAVEPLIRALSDPDPDVRGYAAGSLGEIDDPRTVDPLLWALVDPEERVRKEAAKALEKKGLYTQVHQDAVKNIQTEEL